MSIQSIHSWIYILLACAKSGDLDMISVPFLPSSVLYDVSSSSPHPLVPVVLHQMLFHTLHKISHPCVLASGHHVFSQFVWPGLSQDAGFWACSCLGCQQSKIQTKIKSLVPRIPVPNQRWATSLLSHVLSCPLEFRVPVLLTADRGSQFISTVSPEVCSILGISPVQTKIFIFRETGRQRDSIVPSSLSGTLPRLFKVLCRLLSSSSDMGGGGGGD